MAALKNRRHRVSDALTGNVGGRTMNWFIQAHACQLLSAPSEADGSIPIEPASVDASSVKICTKHVFSDNYIEISGTANQVHGTGVDQHMLERHIGEFGLHDTGCRASPQSRRLEHVGFID
jgi:hypothetical protein